MSKSGKKGMGKFVLGALVGASAGILLAPKKGSETRRDLKNKMDELLAKVKEIDLNDVRDNVEKKINEIQEELKDLDKEKVLKIAKEKGEALKKKAGEVYELAKEKGTPVLEKCAKEVKEKTINVVEELLKKLKNEETPKENKDNKE